MAGSRNSNFNEKLTPYLQQKLVETSEKYGIQSKEYQAFEKQYLKSTKEDDMVEILFLIHKKRLLVNLEILLNFLSKILPDLNVIEVISILLIFFSSIHLSINGRMLMASPTLAI